MGWFRLYFQLDHSVGPYAGESGMHVSLRNNDRYV